MSNKVNRLVLVNQLDSYPFHIPILAKISIIYTEKSSLICKYNNMSKYFVTLSHLTIPQIIGNYKHSSKVSCHY